MVAVVNATVMVVNSRRCFPIRKLKLGPYHDHLRAGLLYMLQSKLKNMLSGQNNL